MYFEKETLAYDEIEINIERIVKKCINNLKWVIMCAFVGALLLTVVKYVNDISEYEIEYQKYANDQVVELTGEEQLEVDNYLLLIQKQQQIFETKENSPIYQIDYENAYSCDLIYYVDGENAKIITNVLQEYLESNAIQNSFSCMIPIAHDEVINEYSIIDNRSEKEIVLGTVWGKDEDELRDYVSQIKDAVTKYDQLLQQSVGVHELKLISENVSVGYSEWIYTEQYNLFSENAIIQKELNTLQTNFVDNQREYIARFENSLLEPSKPSISYVTIFVGLIIGVVASIGVIVVKVLFDGKLQSEDELRKRFRITNLGNINKNNQESEINIISEKLQILLRGEYQKIQILTTMDSISEFIENRLVELLSEKDILCEIYTDMSDDTMKLDAIDMNGAVVIIEQVGVSKVNDLYAEARLCETLNSNVLGYICLN